MQHRIFAGKGAKNNELALRTLYENGYLSAWKLAKEIAINDPTRKPKEDVYHKAQKIQSVLIRKNGRLADLVEKEYIEKSEKGYCLTFNKGFCAALALYEKDIPKPAIDEATKIDAILPEFKEILDILSRHHPEAVAEMYREMRRITLTLLDKGLDFEKISNRQFNSFFADQYEEFYLEELKNKDCKEEKWDPPPELKQSIQKFISRLTSIAQKQIKELEDLQNSYFKNSQKMKNE
jgi:hypothetical protein